MSVVYAVALGHNETGSLAPLDPQPESVGRVPGRRIYAADGTIYEDMFYMELRWSVIDGETAYQTLLAQLGLSTAASAEITLRGRDERFLARVINATVYRPEHGSEITWRDFFPRRLVIIAREWGEAS
jgi:hypothetical protein